MSSKSKRGRGRLAKRSVVRLASTPKTFQLQNPQTFSIQPQKPQHPQQNRQPQNHSTSQWDFDFVVSPPKVARNIVVEEKDLFDDDAVNDDDDDDVIGPSQTIESDDADSSPTSPILSMSEPAIKRLKLGSPKVNR